jgi:hypothetical protein
MNLTKETRQRIVDGLIGWTYKAVTPGQFAQTLRKYMKRNTATAADTQWLLERASIRWGTEEVNRALKQAIEKQDYKTCWHRLASQVTEDYHASVETFWRKRIWFPEAREETRSTKCLKHSERLTFEKDVRLLTHAKELKLLPHEKLTRYRRLAYNRFGKARVKLAWRKVILKPPEREVGLPPPRHQTMNDRLPQALKEYTRLSQEGKEPPATKEELLALFRDKRGHTRDELIAAVDRSTLVAPRCHGTGSAHTKPHTSRNELP